MTNRELLGKTIIINNGCHTGKYGKIIEVDNVWVRVNIEGIKKPLRYGRDEIIMQ